MADLNPKRAKMDNPIGQSSSTSPKDRKIQRRLIDPDTQNFDEIKNMPGFVDHTHFIKSFLGMKPRLAILAPRRFGKSSHLDMLRQFFQVDVDETTGEVSSSVNGPAKERKNYKLFERTRIITDKDNKDLVEDHLGKHPVIHIDFKDASIDSVEAAERHYRKAMHEAYIYHSYLQTSTKLDPGFEEGNASRQRICEEWCDTEKFKQTNKHDLSKSLENLTEFLYYHFNEAKVYILVDNYDAIIASALRKIPKENPDDNRNMKICRIAQIFTSLFGNVAKGNRSLVHVAGLLLTGVSYVNDLLYSPAYNNLTVVRFLGDTKLHPSDRGLVPFYGATREEVESVIQNLVDNKDLVMFEEKEEFLNDTNELDVKKIMHDVESRYNGYFDSKGNCVFCLSSVLQYLQSGDARNYWNQTDGIQDLCMILKDQYVVSEIMKLLRGEAGREPTCCGERVRTTISNLVPLHNFLAMEIAGHVGCTVVFNFLMDQGYVAYPEEGAENRKVILPNQEIRAIVSDMIGDFVENHLQINTTSCTSLIDGINLSLLNDEKALQIKMLNIYEAISLILRPHEQTNDALMNESKMLCIMYKIFNDATSFELCADLQIRDAEDRSIKLDSTDFLLLHKNDKKCSILWKLKYKQYYSKNKYTTSLYALQEARGIVVTKYGETKMFMDSLKKLGREALVIGLSIDSDIKISLSYAVGMEEKIFFKSERESIHFPILYQTYNPVSLSLEKNDD